MPLSGCVGIAHCRVVSAQFAFSQPSDFFPPKFFNVSNQDTILFRCASDLKGAGNFDVSNQDNILFRCASNLKDAGRARAFHICRLGVIAQT